MSRSASAFKGAARTAGCAPRRDLTTCARLERSTRDSKELQRLLADFTDDELKQIPVLPEGTRLQQGATYVGTST